MRYGKKKYFVKMSEKVIVTDVACTCLDEGESYFFIYLYFLFFSALVLFMCFLAGISFFFIFVLKPVELL